MSGVAMLLFSVPIVLACLSALGFKVQGLGLDETLQMQDLFSGCC